MAVFEDGAQVVRLPPVQDQDRGRGGRLLDDARGAVPQVPPHGKVGRGAILERIRQGQGLNQRGWGIVPDLVLIDGGKGHLGAASRSSSSLESTLVPLASLAKENEELFVPQVPEPIVLPRGSQGLFLVQRLRDEAHRFAVTFHRQRRSKHSVQSALDLVPGIGPKRRRMLIRKFGSVKGIREAELEEIAAVPGMTMKQARTSQELPLVEAVSGCFSVYVRCPIASKGSATSTPSYVWPGSGPAYTGSRTPGSPRRRRWPRPSS